MVKDGFPKMDEKANNTSNVIKQNQRKIDEVNKR